MSTYTPTIGIEVHAELKTKSKMFCGCKNDPHASSPNQNICAVCLAHPGTLPSVNKEAVKKLVTVGHAVSGEVANFSEFDRKNYFYPDIPKAYQISQYKFPFVKGGELAGVKLNRIHLEEDTARSQHDHGSIIDFNRAGVPLMELVTEPVIHDEKTAVAFGKELQLLLRSLGISDANMEKGEMRVEANISVSNTEHMAESYVEVKNLNSFKAMEQAIIYEVKRQTKARESGENILKETRGWDENRERTFPQRTKETAQDYRYFPDPDITKYDLAEVADLDVSRLTEIINLSPKNKRILYAEISVPDVQIELIIASVPAEEFFRRVIGCFSDKQAVAPTAANYLTSDVYALAEERTEFSFDDASAENFAELMTMVVDKKINSRVAKVLLERSLFGVEKPSDIAMSEGLLQITDESELESVVAQVVAENEAVADEFAGGKEASLQYLVGQGMKATKGAADPKVLAELLKKLIQKD